MGTDQSPVFRPAKGRRAKQIENKPRLKKAGHKKAPVKSRTVLGGVKHSVISKIEF